jgi:ketosteroid isomerase-like protein
MKRVLLVAAVCLALLPSVRAQSNAAKEVEAVEHARMAAVERRDAEAMPRFLADDFSSTSAQGRVTTRQQYLDGFRTNTTPVKLQHDEVVFRAYGDTVVITGKATTARPDGTLAVSRYTHVYVKQRNEWKMVAMHNSNVTAP